MAVADPLDLTLGALGYRETGGLVENGGIDLDTARAFVWRDLRRKTSVDAAYFRGSVPLVAFARAGDHEIPTLQRKLWNFSRLPLLIASTPTRIGVYSCYAAPTRRDDVQQAELLVVPADAGVTDALTEFARVEVETGRLAAKHPRFFERQERVDRKLLANLRQLRSSLSRKRPKMAVVDALIGRSIFVRYLEDGGILTPEHFAELSSYQSYVEVLQAGVEPTYSLFDALAGRFNGDVFVGVDDERAEVDASDLAVVAGFLEGEEVATGQASFWPYDFSVIPPELISSIYEQLLEENQRADAAYYTPRTVVDLVLDEVLPWDHEGTVRILDPACGSGIFLTQAYRRLAFKATEASSAPLSFEELADLLTTSIFGVDQSAAAISVAAFGLCLALLEETDPPNAWNSAKLPKLIDANLLVQDFFAEITPAFSEFDVIAGNPPWQSHLPTTASDFIAATGHPIADQQLAQAFLWRSLDFLSGGGSLGLLMPSKLLHNKSTRAEAVRQHLYGIGRIETVIDLSALRHELFEAAVAPAAIVVLRSNDLDEDSDGSLLHAVPRSSPLHQTVDGFVLSYEDIHVLPRRLVVTHSDIWKILLWGGERDLDIISRVRAQFRQIGDIAAERGWIHGQGFQIKGGDRNSAAELFGLPFVATESIAPFTADTSSRVVDVKEMHRPREVGLYAGPHVLIRRGVAGGRLAAALVEEKATFNNAVVGVAAPEADHDYLRLLVAYVNSAFGNYYHFLTSSTWGVERDVVEANEHLALPFPELDNPSAADVLAIVKEAEETGVRDIDWWTRLDDAVFAAYELNGAIDQVRDTLAMRLDVFRNGARALAFRPPMRDQLEAYAKSLRQTLYLALPDMTLAVRVIETAAPYGVVLIGFGEDNLHGDVPDWSAELEDLIRTARLAAANWPSPVMILQPVALIMRDTRVYLLKPMETRFWTVSAAQDDAADVIGQIAKSPTLAQKE
jgi:hypothetical protein